MSGAAARQGLHRSLGPIGVILLVISMTSPAGSVLTAGTDIIHQVGGAAVLAFLIATPVVLANTVLAAELYSAFPNAGGLYTPVARIWGPAYGMVILAFACAGPPAYISLFALGLVSFLKVVWPFLQDGPTAAAVVAVATGIALLSIRANAWITGAFLAIEVITILVVSGLGVVHPARGLAAAMALPAPPFAGVSAHGATLIAIGMAAIAANWSVSGGAQAIYFSEEMRRPKDLGWVIIAAALSVAALEIGPVVGLVVGAHKPGAVLGDASPFMALFAETMPAWAVRAFSLAVAAALFNAVLAMVIAYARIWFATGRDRVWPAAVSGPLAEVAPRLGSPWIATLILGLICGALCFASLHALVVYSSGLGLVADFVAAMSVLRGRRLGLLADAPYKAPFAWGLGALSVVSMIGAVAAQLSDADAGRPGILIAAAIAALAVIYYFAVLRRRSNGWRFALFNDTDIRPVQSAPVKVL